MPPGDYKDRRGACADILLLTVYPFSGLKVTEHMKGKEMCITPSHVWIQKGRVNKQVQVACGKCWRCRSNRINDFVARGLCEAHTSDWVKVMTLTYAPRDDGAEKVINPEHLQKFIRALRIRKLKIRYMAAGEYGKLRDRAHFHVIIFGKGKQPVTKDGKYYPHRKMFHIEEWPHGHVRCENNGMEQSIRYCCKYMLKGEPGEYWYTLSKRPPLGYEYFKQRAAEYAKSDMLPTGFKYMPPGGKKGREYLLTGASRKYFLKELLEQLRNKASEKIGNKTVFEKTPLPSASEWVKKMVNTIDEKETRDEAEVQMQERYNVKYYKEIAKSNNSAYNQEKRKRRIAISKSLAGKLAALEIEIMRAEYKEHGKVTYEPYTAPAA